MVSLHRAGAIFSTFVKTPIRWEALVERKMWRRVRTNLAGARYASSGSTRRFWSEPCGDWVEKTCGLFGMSGKKFQARKYDIQMTAGWSRCFSICGQMLIIRGVFFLLSINKHRSFENPAKDERKLHIRFLLSPLTLLQNIFIKKAAQSLVMNQCCTCLHRSLKVMTYNLVRKDFFYP